MTRRFAKGVGEAGARLSDLQSTGESGIPILQEMWDGNWPRKSRSIHDRFFD